MGVQYVLILHIHSPFKILYLLVFMCVWLEVDLQMFVNNLTWVLGTNLGCLQEQCVLLTTELSHKLPNLCFNPLYKFRYEYFYIRIHHHISLEIFVYLIAISVHRLLPHSFMLKTFLTFQNARFFSTKLVLFSPTNNDILSLVTSNLEFLCFYSFYKTER